MINGGHSGLPGKGCRRMDPAHGSMPSDAAACANVGIRRAGPQRRTQVAKACAYGDFDKLKQMVDADVSCVNQADEQGYLPLQVRA